MSSFKDKIKGAFDLTFFFERGIAPFENEGTKAHALRSLWIPVALYPFNVLACWMHPPKGLEHLARIDLFIVTTAECWLGLALSAVTCFLFAYAIGAEKRFWLFFQAGNWMEIPAAIVSVPFLFLVMGTHMEAVRANHVLSVVGVYCAMSLSCAAFRGLKINWELSVFVASWSMLMYQLIENMMFKIYGIPIDWLG